MRRPAKAGGQVRRQNRKVGGRRKSTVGGKVSWKIQSTDEELEVGPKVKSEEAVSGASWKLI
jgi:hypothetical protein